MRFTLTFKLFGPDGEVTEIHTYRLETQEAVDHKIMLLRLKYPLSEFDVKP